MAAHTCAHKNYELAQRQQRNELFICCRCSAALHRLRARRCRRSLPWTVSDGGLIQWRCAACGRKCTEMWTTTVCVVTLAKARLLYVVWRLRVRRRVGRQRNAFSPRRTRRRRRARREACGRGGERDRQWGYAISSDDDAPPLSKARARRRCKKVHCAVRSARRRLRRRVRDRIPRHAARQARSSLTGWRWRGTRQR